MKELALHILDIGHNSVAAGASMLQIEMDYRNDGILQLSFEDNGKGMSSDEAQKALSPYFTGRTTRKVGLGLPLLKHTAEQCGGELSIVSERGRGTKVVATFQTRHIDLPPVGDLAGIVMMLATAKEDMRLLFTLRSDGKSYTFDTEEIKQALGGNIPLNHPVVADDIRGLFIENSNEIRNFS